MPLIKITRNPQTIDDEVLERVLEVLPKSAAKALSTEEGGQLTEAEMMVEVDDIGPKDRNVPDIGVIILAHDYNERKLNLDERREFIQHEVVDCLPIDTKGYVWLILAPTSYGGIGVI